MRIEYKKYFSPIARVAFLTIVTVGFFAALPYVSNTNITYAGESCPGGNCGPFTDKWQKKWNGFKCPDFRNGKMSGDWVDSRYRKSSPFPGCADKVRVAVECNTCYKITLKGTYDYNCDTPRKNEHQITDVLFQMPNAYNKNKLQTVDGVSFQKFNYFSFNDGSIRSIYQTYQDKKIDEIYPKPTSNHIYEFFWNSKDKTSIEMYIKEYPNGNYIDNNGKIKYEIEEVESKFCEKFCPTPETPQDPHSE